MPTFLLSAAILISGALAVTARAQDALPEPSQPAPAGQAPQDPAAPEAAPPPALDETTYRQQYSYALGRNFAENLRQNEIDCNLDFLLQGISDALRKAEPKWTDAQLEVALERFGQEMQQKATARMDRLAAKNQQQATNFLVQNAKREGVQTTASGLQYRVVREGDGASPTISDRVRCHYRGMLLDGTEFDSSSRQGQPVEFPVNRVIPGWTEALQKMKVGDKWQLFVPPKLAYGLEPPGAPIEPNSLLVFDIELVEIVQP